MKKPCMYRDFMGELSDKNELTTKNITIRKIVLSIVLLFLFFLKILVNINKLKST